MIQSILLTVKHRFANSRVRECFNPVNSSNKRQRKTNLFNDTILDNFESEKVREGQGFLTQKTHVNYSSFWNDSNITIFGQEIFSHFAGIFCLL